MLRKMKMDPLRIHNYNKFLITLDKTTVTTKTANTKVEEEPIKPNVDTIINNITIDYYLNGRSTSSFTGETNSDILNNNMVIDDPNEYKSKINEKKEIIVGKLFKPYTRKIDPYIDSEVKVKVKENQISIKIKDFVNIDL